MRKFVGRTHVETLEDAERVIDLYSEAGYETDASRGGLEITFYRAAATDETQQTVPFGYFGAIFTPDPDDEDPDLLDELGPCWNDSADVLVPWMAEHAEITLRSLRDTIAAQTLTPDELNCARQARARLAAVIDSHRSVVRTRDGSETCAKPR